ncbi:reverse transcriptase domain-containing protein [Tanacetum coccineum]
MTITRSGMTPEAIEELVNRRVEEALAAYEANRAANALEAENQRQNGSDGDNGNGGDGNSENGNDGNGNPNENNRDARSVARECTYQDFMKCQPLNFKGTEGVVRLIRWFEKMETVFYISNCPKKYQVKYAICILLNKLMKLMTEMYCPRNKIQKMESELWNLTVKNNNLAAYTQRFQELSMMCTKMVPEEEDRVEKFVGGLPNNIQGNVIAAEPTRLLDPPLKRPNVGGQNVARAYTAGNNEKKSYNGPLPLCNKCKLHHEGPCTVRCRKCNKIGHLTWDCKVINSTTSTQRGQMVNQRVLTCFECGRQGHYRSDCPKLKIKTVEIRLETRMELVKQQEKHICWVEEKLTPIPMSTLLNITPDTLDVSYAVELVDGRISKTNTILRGYEVLIVQGDRDGKGEKSKLSITSCTRTQKYIKRGCPVFLAQDTKKETEDKSEEKRLEDVPTVRNFLEVFPEDFPGLPPTR